VITTAEYIKLFCAGLGGAVLGHLFGHAIGLLLWRWRDRRRDRHLAMLMESLRPAQAWRSAHGGRAWSTSPDMFAQPAQRAAPSSSAASVSSGPSFTELVAADVIGDVIADALTSSSSSTPDSPSITSGEGGDFGGGGADSKF
jgi:hypothetical protein